MTSPNYHSTQSLKLHVRNIFPQDDENGAEEVESEEDSGIQSKEELPHSPEKKRIATQTAKTKSNGGARVAEEAEQPVRGSGDGGGRKKVGQSRLLLYCNGVVFRLLCVCLHFAQVLCFAFANFNLSLGSLQVPLVHYICVRPLLDSNFCPILHKFPHQSTVHTRVQTSPETIPQN